MKTLAVTFALAFAANAAIAADLDADQRRALDDQVIHGRHGYAPRLRRGPDAVLRGAAGLLQEEGHDPARASTTGDGITCHYDRYTAQ